MASSSFVPRPVLLLEDIEGLAEAEPRNSNTPVGHGDDGGGGGGNQASPAMVVTASGDERVRRDRSCAQASPASSSYLEVPRRGQGESSNGSASAALHSQYRQR